MDPQTLSVDGLPVVVPGGTQVFKLETDGWSWMWAGGGEFWLSPIAADLGRVLVGEARGRRDGRRRGQPQRHPDVRRRRNPAAAR